MARHTGEHSTQETGESPGRGLRERTGSSERSRRNAWLPPAASKDVKISRSRWSRGAASERA
eukprot:scaffold169936_cov26-Tisochrysis_lutea.AAC.1